MFFQRCKMEYFSSNPNSAKNPILAIIALITIGGSMCFVSGGMFLFSAVALHQSDKYCSAFLIIFIGIVLMGTCYLAWILTSHRFECSNLETTLSEEFSSETVKEFTKVDDTPPSYDDAIKDV